MGTSKNRVITHFCRTTEKYGVFNKKRKTYIKGIIDCLDFLSDGAWHIINDDTDSCPECGVYVPVEDDCGERFVAVCDANCKWSVTNGESSMPLIGEVIKWLEID